MTQLVKWAPVRRPDGSVNARRFGGMKIERTGSPRIKPASICIPVPDFPGIPANPQRFDEHFAPDILLMTTMRGLGGNEYDGRHVGAIRQTPW